MIKYIRERFDIVSEIHFRKHILVDGHCQNQTSNIVLPHMEVTIHILEQTKLTLAAP